MPAAAGTGCTLPEDRPLRRCLQQQDRLYPPRGLHVVAVNSSPPAIRWLVSTDVPPTGASNCGAVSHLVPARPEGRGWGNHPDTPANTHPTL